MNGPLSPEEMARIASYYGGTPGQNMSQPVAPTVGGFYALPSAPGAPPPQDFGLNLTPPPGPGAPPPSPAPPPPQGGGVEALPPSMQAAVTGAIGPAPTPKPPQATEYTGGKILGTFDPSKPQATAPSGPSAQDDAEFAAFKSRLAAKPVARTPVSGGGGGSGNSDPFGMKAAQRKVIGSYDQQMSAARGEADADAAKVQQVSERREEFARMQDEDAAIGRQEQEQFSAEFGAKMAEVRGQIADLREKKIDPNRILRGDDMKVKAMIGGLLGGLYMGLTKGTENPFLRDLDRSIDRDIAAQEKDLANQREAVNDEFNMLAQQRALFKDSAAAKLQFKNLAYEATKERIAAESDRLGTPAAKARAEQGISQLTREQGKVEMELAKTLQAQQAAGAQRSEQFRKEMRDTYIGTYEKALATGMPAEQAEAEATRMVQNIYGGGAGERAPAGPGVSPLASVPKDMKAKAAEEFQAAGTTKKVLTSISGSFQDWRKTDGVSPRQLASTRSAIAGTIMASVPGIRSDVDFKEIVEPNLPARGDSEETLRKKEATIARFVESKASTPLLDTYAPGWKGPERVKRNPVSK